MFFVTMATTWCSLPSKVTSQCDKFVDDKLHQVVAMVTKNIGVNEVCQELSICPKKSEVPTEKHEEKVPVKTQEVRKHARFTHVHVGRQNDNLRNNNIL